MHPSIRNALALAAIASTAGCETQTYLHVESDTEWSGVVIGAKVDRWHETGDAWTRLGSGTLCWEFTKLAEEGYLRAYVREKSLLSTDEFHRDETTDPQGGVHGCVNVE